MKKNFDPYDIWLEEKIRREREQVEKVQNPIVPIEQQKAEKAKADMIQMARKPKSETQNLQPASGVSPATRQAAMTAASGGGLGDMALSGGIVSGSPELIAAGAGLKVLSNIQQRQRQEEVDKYNAAIDKNQRQRNAINSLIQVGRGLRL